VVTELGQDERLERLERALSAYILMSYGNNLRALTSNAVNARYGQEVRDFLHAMGAERS